MRTSKTIEDFAHDDRVARIVAISDRERLEARVQAARTLDIDRTEILRVATVLDDVGDTDLHAYVQVILAAMDDALDAIAEVAGGKAE